MAYIAPRSLEESGRVDEDILGKMGSRKGMGRLKIKWQPALISSVKLANVDVNLKEKEKVGRTEMSIIRWICGSTLKESVEIRALLWMEPVSLVIC